MRVGRLKSRADVLTAAGDLVAAGVRVSVPTGNGEAVWNPGLRQSSVTVRCRWLAALRGGMVLAFESGEWYLVASAMDPDGKRRDMLCNCIALVGAAAVVDPDGSALPALVALLAYRAKPGGDYGYLDDAGQMRRQAEFINAQHTPAVADEFTADGSLWRVTELDLEHSDSVVTRVWLEFLTYV